uniref:Uncharacterized protein n=1 Tax=Eptatretus burgeri TaxID=7764 RepID=A0A8C4QHG0_EPTBU
MVWTGGLASSGTKHQMLNPEQFDTVPLISPLDVDSLCSPAPRKVRINLTNKYINTVYKFAFIKIIINKLHNVHDLPFNAQVSAMLLVSMVFLTCILFLVLYQLYSYDTCPSPLNSLATYFDLKISSERNQLKTQSLLPNVYLGISQGGISYSPWMPTHGNCPYF